MARYNPKNKQHRKTLAKRIAGMLGASGFSVDASARGEVVYTRPVDGVKAGSAQVRVLTSIVGDQMRQKDKDAIRVCAVYTDNTGQSRGLVKSTRINRTGDMEAITGRLLQAMRKTYRAASKRANDQGFLALPVKTSKKRWVPRAKKSASKPKTARRLNTAVKAAAEKQEETPVFTVGQLVSSIIGERKGIIKGLEIDGLVTVFWLDGALSNNVYPASLQALAA